MVIFSGNAHIPKNRSIVDGDPGEVQVFWSTYERDCTES